MPKCKCFADYFPRFLKHQHALDELSLSNNKISGYIPEWLLEEIFGTLDLSFNYFQVTRCDSNERYRYNTIR